MHQCISMRDTIYFIAYVIRHAPDGLASAYLEFPASFRPNDNMDLRWAFDELRHGLDCLASTTPEPVIAECRTVLEKAYNHYQNCEITDGASMLEGLRQLLQMVPCPVRPVIKEICDYGEPPGPIFSSIPMVDEKTRNSVHGHLFMWIRERYRDPPLGIKVAHARTTAPWWPTLIRIVDSVPEFKEVFEVSDGKLDFRSNFPLDEQQMIERYVKAMRGGGDAISYVFLTPPPM